MFEFRDRVVYLISPESWGRMRISKHHYALGLAERNCRVFFIEPPSHANRGIRLRPCDDHPNITLVSYKPVFRGKRFLPKALYVFLLHLQVRMLRRRIGLRPDVVWSFHGYLFGDLGIFGAPVNIFFAADFFGYDELPEEAASATFCMAVSDTIYKRISECGHRVHQINHGVTNAFAHAAELMIEKGDFSAPSGRLTVGYVGNLRMEAIDRATMREVIDRNPDIRFVFWGSYKAGETNLGGLYNEEVDSFIRFLEQTPNVELRGVKGNAELVEEMRVADLFWMCLNIGSRRMWDGSNSHKILEYLSTGKPVVSHFVSSYRGTDLLYMMQSTDNAGYPDLFSRVVALVRAGEDHSRIEKRLREVVSNTYASHLDRIEAIVRAETE